jgi:hypothetical protein
LKLKAAELKLRTLNSERPSNVIYKNGWKSRSAGSSRSTSSELRSIHSSGDIQALAAGRQA